MGGGGSSETSSSSTTEGTMGFAQLIHPEYGYFAAQAQEQAADAAAKVAQTQITNAMASMQQQFSSATKTLQPYTAAGAEALNKLNYFMGLQSYKPLAPTDIGAAPKSNLLTKADIDHDQVLQYLAGHTQTVDGKDITNKKGKVIGKEDPRTYYMGVGSGGGYMTPEQWQGASKDDITAVGNAALEAQIKQHLADQQNKYLKPLDDAQQELYKQKQAQYEQDLAIYNQQMDSYNKYSALAPATGDTVMEEIKKDPNYQFQLDQGIKGLAANSSAAGYLGSGRMLKELQTFGSGLAANAYGTMLSNLASIAGQGQQAATQQSNLYAGLGQGNANLLAGLGDTQANAKLAAGQARASAYLNAGTYIKPLEGKITTKSKSSTSTDSGGGGIGSILGGIGGIMGAF